MQNFIDGLKKSVKMLRMLAFAVKYLSRIADLVEEMANDFQAIAKTGNVPPSISEKSKEGAN